jgi:hypothetical protein
MGYKRQTAEANLARSLGYKKTASKVKLDGHKAEDIYASFFGGKVIKGNGKTDVKCPVYGNTTVKAPAGGKVQMLLQTTDNVKLRWGKNHPMYLASESQRRYYEDRHFNAEKNSTTLYEEAKKHVALLTKWMSDKENFRQVLNYALLNDGDIDNVVDMYGTNGEYAYISKGIDFIQEIINADPIPKQTPSGLRISVSILIGKFDKEGVEKRKSVFSFEVRSNSKHCKSFLHKMEGGTIFPLIRSKKVCTKVDNPMQ